MNVLLVVAIVALLVGVLLLVRGVIGRKVDSYPHCRRCGFNLHGRWPETVVCSECGAVLEKPRAVKHGKRTRRWGALGIGVVLLVLGSGPMVMHFSGPLQQVQLLRYAPFWWLILETESESDDFALAAMTELLRRGKKGSLTPAQKHEVVDAILLWQGDVTTTWTTAMGDFVEKENFAGSLKPEQWRQYVDQGLIIKLSIPEKLHVGSVLPTHIDKTGIRFGSRMYRLKMQPVKLEIDGQEHAVHGGTMTVSFRSGQSQLSSMGSYRDFEVGRHHISYVYRFTLLSSNSSVERTVDADISIVPQDELLVKLVSGSQYDEDVCNAVSVDQIKISLPRGIQKGKVQAMVHIHHQPIGVAFDVIFRSSEREWHMGGAVKDSGGLNGFFVMKDFQEMGFDPSAIEAMDVILRTNPLLVDGFLGDLDVIWDGEIVIEDVPVVLD